MSKSKLRALTLGKKKSFEKRIVEIEGEKFEIRQPTIGQRGEIRNKSMKIDTSNEEDKKEAVQFDMFSFMICAVVELTYVPETNERVFSDEDYDELKSLPAGGWFDKLTKEASELCNVEDKDVKKPSEETVKK